MVTAKQETVPLIRSQVESYSHDVSARPGFNQNGSTMLEMTFVSLIFLIIVSALIDLSFILFDRATSLYLVTNVTREISKIPLAKEVLTVAALEELAFKSAERVAKGGVKGFQQIADIRVGIRCPSDKNYPEFLARNLQYPYVQVEYRLKSPCLFCLYSDFRRELGSKAVVTMTNLPLGNVKDCN